MFLFWFIFYQWQALVNVFYKFNWTIFSTKTGEKRHSIIFVCDYIRTDAAFGNYIYNLMNNGYVGQ